MMNKELIKEKLQHKQQLHAELDAILEKNYPAEDAKEIKRIISEYYFNKLSQAFETQAAIEGWNAETYEQWANEHFRSSAKLS